MVAIIVILTPSAISTFPKSATNPITVDISSYSGTEVNVHVAANMDKAIEFYQDLTHNKTITKIIINEAIKRHLPINFVMAVVFNESAFDPNAENYNLETVDRGLFQLNSGSFPDLTYSEIFDIRRNVYEGCLYLRALYDQYNENPILTVYAFNAGMGKIASGKIKIRTLIHTEKIMMAYRYLDFQYTYYVQGIDLAVHNKFEKLVEMNSNL
jgi:soluble lytic murein transglycosylase-like protein